MLTTIWTCPSGNYQLRKTLSGRWHWFVICLDGTWQQLLGTMPPATVVEEFARQSYDALIRARQGLTA